MADQPDSDSIVSVTSRLGDEEFDENREPIPAVPYIDSDGRGSESEATDGRVEPANDGTSSSPGLNDIDV